MNSFVREEIERERASLKARFGDAYSKLEALLFEEDPMGINFGANTDEYDAQVRTILPDLPSCRTPEEVQALVHRELCFWFGGDAVGPPERYERLAWRIVAELPEVWGKPGGG